MPHKVLVINEKRPSSKESDHRSATNEVQKVAAIAPDNLVTRTPQAAYKEPLVPTAGGVGNSIEAVELGNLGPEAGHLNSIDKDPSNDADQALQREQQQFALSPMRWPTLVGIMIYGMCNGIVNETNSVLQVYVAVVGLSLSNYIYLSQLFFFMPFVASFLTAASVDKLGVRLTIFVSILVVALRNSARALLFSPEVALWSDLKIVYWMLQRALSAITTPMYYCLPLRIAESWFAESERSLALTLLLVAPRVGQSLASLIFPHFIVGIASASPLAYINLAGALITIMAVTLAVRRSRPREGAPSARSLANQNRLRKQNEDNESLWAKVRRIVSNSNYLIHVLVLHALDPLMGVLQTILQDIFLNAGLTQVFCGQFLAFSAILSVTLQITGSIFLKSRSGPRKSQGQSPADGTQIEIGSEGEKTIDGKGPLKRGDQKKRTYDPYRTRTCKIFISLQCAAFILFAHTLILHELYPYEWLINAQWWLIIVAAIVYNVVRCSAAPYYNEQSAELICGAISEPLSSACQMTIVTLLHNVAAILFVRLRWEASDPRDQLDSNSSDSPIVKPRAFYRLSVLFFCAFAITLTTLYLVKFRPTRSKTSAVSEEEGNSEEKVAPVTKESQLQSAPN